MMDLKIPHSWLNQPVRVCLVGCGGTGSELIDELFRIHSLLISLGGWGLKVIAYDGDVVSESNIGRQRFWHSDIGFNKAEVLITRLNSFGRVNWSYVDQNLNIDEINESNYSGFDLIITCVDKASVRAEIGKKSQSNNEISSSCLWLDCGNGTYSGNVVLGNLSSQDFEGRVPNVFDLYPILTDMEDDTTQSCSTQEAIFKQTYGINRSVAREAANLIWLLLRRGKVDFHGSYIDIHQGSVTPLKLDTKVWASFGFLGSNQ